MLPVAVSIPRAALNAALGTVAVVSLAKLVFSTVAVELGEEAGT